MEVGSGEVGRGFKQPDQQPRNDQKQEPSGVVDVV